MRERTRERRDAREPVASQKGATGSGQLECTRHFRVWHRRIVNATIKRGQRKEKRGSGRAYKFCGYTEKFIPPNGDLPSLEQRALAVAIGSSGPRRPLLFFR